MNISAQKAWFGIEIPLEQFSPLATAHIARVPDTADIEVRGRVLSKKGCPVFDALLRSALPYSFDPRGYAQFATDCGRLAAELTRLAIQNPRPARNGRWLVADTEASIYEFVRRRFLREV